MNRIARVVGKAADENAEELCEMNASAKFLKTDPDGCTQCTDLGALANRVGSEAENVIDVYCATPHAAQVIRVPSPHPRAEPATATERSKAASP